MANEFNLNDLVRNRVLPPLPGPVGRAMIQPDEVVVPAADAFDGELRTVTVQALRQAQGDGQTAVATTGMGGKFDQFGNRQVMPLEISVDEGKTWWLLPIEPMIGIKGSNVLVKRNVAKKEHRGTVKERWSVDDYSITINGLLRSATTTDFPMSDFLLLRKICEHSRILFVRNPEFEALNISRLAIEDYEFPFTKGQDYQSYQISAVSDDFFELLIPLNE